VGFQPDDIARLRAALARIARAVDRQAAAEGLSPTQLIVLAAVARAGSIGVGELAEAEAINPTMLSRIVGKLVAADLVARRTDTSDGRAARVEITPAGARLHKRRQQERTKIFAKHLADLPAETSDALLEVLPALESLADHLNEKVRI
jgi:DNA-binding MarR family transcriptional regulator